MVGTRINGRSKKRRWIERDLSRGDRAYHELLNIYENEFVRNPGKTDLRWRIEHAQVIRIGHGFHGRV